MNNGTLTQLFGGAASDIDPYLDNFLATQSLHERGAEEKLNSAMLIEIDEGSTTNVGCGNGLPAGYFNSSNGLVFAKAKKTATLSATPIIPFAKRMSHNKKSQIGIELMTTNYAGQNVTASVLLADMSRNPDQVVTALVTKGFGVSSSPQSKTAFEKFLQACMKMDLPVYLVADSMGFVKGESAFLHGDMPIARGITGFDYLLLQKDILSGIHASGTLSAWKTLIADNVYGWPQLFALSASFASMLLPMAGMDSAMFHFYGGSTTGKTVILQVAMSVHAHGGEPGSHPDVAITRWHTTANALEQTLSMLSGLVACIDEMGAYKNRDFASLLYNMTSGRAKSRLDKSLKMRTPASWLMFILSSGEMSVAEKLASQNEQLQGGQEHRAISLNIQSEDAQREGESIKDVCLRADTLKTELGEVYGSAGKAFMACYLSQSDDSGHMMSYADLSAQIKEGVSDCCQVLEDELEEEGYTLSAIQHRALKRFALCYAAGVLATCWGILPFGDDDIKDAVMSAVRRWLEDDLNQYSPVKKVLLGGQLDLIKKHAVHFMPLLEQDAYQPGDHWGYTHNKNGDFMVFAPVFEHWCSKGGMKSADVAKTLAAKNYLQMESKGHYRKRPQAGIDRPFYQISRSFLNCDIATTF